MKKFLGLIVILCIVLAVMKNPIAKAAVESGVKVMTGLDLSISSLKVGVLKSYVGIKDLKLNNPAGFPDPTMVDMPEIYVDYNLGAFLKKNVHLEEVRIDLNEVYIVTDAQGNMNLDALKMGGDEKDAKPKDTADKAEPKAAASFAIDLLKVRVGTVYIKDYSKGAQPKVQEIKINIDEEYANIDSQAKLIRLVTWTVLKNKAIPNLPGLQNFIGNNLGNVNELVGNSLQAAQQLGGQATKQLTETTNALKGTATSTVKDAAAIGKDTLGTATGAVKDTTDALKKLNPFGE